MADIVTKTSAVIEKMYEGKYDKIRKRNRRPSYFLGDLSNEESQNAKRYVSLGTAMLVTAAGMIVAWWVGRSTE